MPSFSSMLDRSHSQLWPDCATPGARLTPGRVSPNTSALSVSGTACTLPAVVYMPSAGTFGADGIPLASPTSGMLPGSLEMATWAAVARGELHSQPAPCCGTQPTEGIDDGRPSTSPSRYRAAGRYHMGRAGLSPCGSHPKPPRHGTTAASGQALQPTPPP
eukprot:769883-Prymnesium_polylepis.1